MCTDEIDPDVLDVLREERSRGRKGPPEGAKRRRERQKLAGALDEAMRRADQHGFNDALRSGGIAEGSAAWKNAWAAYYAYQKHR